MEAVTMNPIYVAELITCSPPIEEMWSSLPWDERTPARKECFFNKRGTEYTYGEGRGQRTYIPANPMLSPTWLSHCWDIVEAHHDKPFEACFINGYENQWQHLGWHADDSDMINHELAIVVISFGAEREIWTKPIEGDDVSKWPLGNGSMFIMPPGFQQTHLHRIPKHSAECGKRISLTFRALI